MEPTPLSDLTEAHDAVVTLRARLVAAVVAVLGMTKAEAEDVVSEVVVRVMESGARPTGGASWATYLRAAVLNEGRNAVASAKARAEREVRFILRRGHDVAVDSVAVTTAWLAALDDLGTLSADEQRVFVLHHYYGKTFPQIADEMGLPVGGVRSRHRQAAAKLAQRQKIRENDPVWMPLFAVLYRLSERARVPVDPGVLSSPIAGCVAALAVVAALGAHPVVSDNWRGRADNPVPRSVTYESSGRPAQPPVAMPGPISSTTPPAAAGTPLPAHAPPTAAAAPSPSPSATPTCAVVICVERSPAPSENPAPAGGDAVTVTGTGRTVRQYVTPLCWSVPQQEWMSCESGEPGSYWVEGDPYQEPPPAGANSRLSVPRSGEPSRGPQQ